MRRRVLLAPIVIAAQLLIAAPEAGATTATVTARGRFVYVDDTGAVIGIRHARVEMCDEDFVFGCPMMARGQTDANGYYSLRGHGSDAFGDRPDPRIKVLAQSESGSVQTPWVPATYCFMSGFVDNAHDGARLAFGTLSPNEGVTCDALKRSTREEHGAWSVNNNVRQAWEFVRRHSLANPGRDVPPVRVFWPDDTAGNSFYRPGIPGVDQGAISLMPDRAFNEPTIMHEYGHHVLVTFAESPVPFYINGNCDDKRLFGGHCDGSSELGSIHWTEGWPDYLSAVLTTYYGKNEHREVEQAPHNIDGTHVDTKFDKIEGYTSAILWDLHDNARDNHDGNRSIDRLAEGFATQWDVLMRFDPDPDDPGHNKITDIHEFWRGVAALRPELANRLSEIYHENHIAEPAADLEVRVLTMNTSTARPGDGLALWSVTANGAQVGTGVGSATTLWLSADATRDGFDHPLGRVSLAAVAARFQVTASTAVTVPPVSPGRYFLLACADSDDAVFEATEANNCRSTSTSLTVTT